MKATNKYGTSNISYYVLLLGIVLIAMEIPKLSPAILILIFTGIIIKWSTVKSINEAFFLRMVLLLLFAATYFSILAYYGYNNTTIANAVKYTIYLVGMYAIGFVVGKANKPSLQDRPLSMMLSPVTGAVLFSFLCVYREISNGNLLEIAERAVPSFWAGSDLINGPGLGALASLGICLAPVLFLSTREGMGKTKYYSFKLIVLLLVIIGSYTNLALQNRGPFVALAVSFFAALCLVFFTGMAKSASYKSRFAISLLLIVLLGWVIIYTDLFSQFTMFERFAHSGIESPGRSTAWLLMMKGIFSSLAGGRFVDIQMDYVHNAWLDVAYDTGIVPFLLLLIFHGSHVSIFIKLFKSSLNSIMVLMITCLSVSFFVSLFIEPALPLYLAISCYFLGLVLRISEDIKQELDSSGGTSTCV